MQEPPPEVELGSLSPEPVARDKPSAHPFLVAALATVGLLMALVIGVSMLTGGDGDGSDADDLASTGRVDASGVEGSGFEASTAEVGEARLEDLEPFAVEAPTATLPPPPPTSEPTPAPMDSALAVPSLETALAITNEDDGSPFPFGELSGYLAVHGSAGLQLVDLSTGQTTDVASGRNVGPQLLSRHGIVMGDFSGDEQKWHYAPWTAGALTRLAIPVGYFPVRIIDDPAGPLLVMSSGLFNGVEGGLRALHLISGEQRQIALDGSLSEEAHSSWMGTDNQDPSLPLLLEVAGSIFRWSWDEEWVPVTNGNLIMSGSETAVIDRCSTPTDCARSQVSLMTGQQLKELPVFPELSARWGRLSPGARYAGFPSFGGFQPRLAVWSLESGVVEDYGVVDPGTMLWIGESELLFSTPESRNYQIVDVETGAITDLDAQWLHVSSLAWFPELVGFADSPG